MKQWTLPPPSQEDVAEAERAESVALVTSTANSLSLGQWAGARLSLRALHARDAGSALRLLEVLARLGPLPGWLASDAMPSAAHVSWLAAGEHRIMARLQRDLSGILMLTRWDSLQLLLSNFHIPGNL